MGSSPSHSQTLPVQHQGSQEGNDSHLDTEWPPEGRSDHWAGPTTFPWDSRAGRGVSCEPEFVAVRAGFKSLAFNLDRWEGGSDWCWGSGAGGVGCHPGVPVLSSSHQMLPGELWGTGWGWGEPGAGHCCPEAEMGPRGWRHQSWLPVGQLAVSNRRQFPGRGRQVKSLLVDERPGADDGHNRNLINYARHVFFH